MLKNTLNSYGSLTKFIHWLMALIIISLIAVGFFMADMENSDQKWFLYGTHKAFGIIVLSLIPLRIIWRLMNPQPTLPKSLPNWQKKAANANILFLYLCMVAMPLSGFIMSFFGNHPISMFGIFTIPAIERVPAISGFAHETHEILALAITASISLHILGALHHHFTKHDQVLKRMLPGCK